MGSGSIPRKNGQPQSDSFVFPRRPDDVGGLVKSIEELKDKKLRFVATGNDSPIGFAVEKILEAYGMPLQERVASGRAILPRARLHDLIALLDISADRK